MKRSRPKANPAPLPRNATAVTATAIFQRREVLEALRGRLWRTAAEIAAATGLSLAVVAPTLRALMASGDVVPQAGDVLRFRARTITRAAEERAR